MFFYILTVSACDGFWKDLCRLEPKHPTQPHTNNSTHSTPAKMTSALKIPQKPIPKVVKK